ncbi:MAG: glycosyltransferase family 39 protein, partial [Thermodesulfobacteriota bacterium]|nr:glycosyltransferase family 39 protein [Thermodesulfobacteriota bacterium]
MTRSAKFLYLALALGILLRAGLFFLVAKDPDVLTRFDQQMYIELSGYLADHLDFAAGFGTERLPLYPVFLALCNFVSENNLLFAVGVQNLLGLATVFFIYKIGRFFSRDAANLAAGLAAVNLNMIVYSNQVLTESIFYPLFAYSIFIFFEYKETKQRKYLYSLALVWGICTLIRSVTLYIPVFMVVYLLLERSQISFAKKAAQGVVFICIFCAVLSPWVLRNYRVYRH